MTFPRFLGEQSPPPPRPEAAPASAPDPESVADFESLVSAGVGAVVAFHAAHPMTYERLHRDYLSRASAGRVRPMGK